MGFGWPAPIRADWARLAGKKGTLEVEGTAPPLIRGQDVLGG